MPWSVTPQSATHRVPSSLQAIENKLSSCIADAVAEGLNETAALLHMARLDLLTRMHGITQEEFDAFLCTAREVAEVMRQTKSKRDAVLGALPKRRPSPEEHHPRR